MTSQAFDVIMIGGGVVGCAISYYLLKAEPQMRVALIEMDPTYVKSSTLLSEGNLRVQFNIKENIQMSQYGLEALACFAEEMAVGDDKPDVAFRQQGNLFLVDEPGRAEAEEGLARQQSLGCQVEWLTPAQIQQHYPLYNLAGCVGGTLGHQDGTMDPNAVLMGYRNKIIALGAHFIQGEVIEILKKRHSVTGVRLASGETLIAKFILNSAGAWAAQIAQTIGINLPVQPVKRQVFVLETTAQPNRILPALFFPSGLYLIHENGGQFMLGKSLPDDPVGLEFGWDRQRFVDLLWPELVDYIPSFDRLKVTRGWAGLYAVNTLDGNAILGEWPELKGFYLANGFSGHGFQQCHAVGRYIAQLMLGQAPTLDLSIFSPQRILDNKPVFESRRKII